MTMRLVPFRGVICRALLAAFLVSLLPSPALANGIPDKAKTPSLKDAMTKVVQRDLAKDTTRRTVRASASAGQTPQSADPAKESPSFFKSRTGVIVLVVLAAGAGYAIYSTQNDRINSPGRE